MDILLPLLIGAVVGGIIGLCAGWLARGREQVVTEKVVTQTVEKPVEPTSQDAAQQRDQAQEILAELQHWTSGVSAKIDAHSREVGNISQELTQASQGEAPAVVVAIRRLVESNSAMQSQLHMAQTQLQHQATLLEAQQQEARTDPLTKLGNRRAFDDELARRLQECSVARTSLSLAMFDVDHFKKCNDTYGHLAGDEVLRAVGRTLAEGAQRNQGVFAARYGGEEFALLIPSSQESGFELAELLRRTIGLSTVTFENQTLNVTASAGISAWRTGDAAENLIARADEALYAAKKTGRNCSCLHEGSGIRKFTGKHADDKPHVRNSPHTVELDSSEAMVKAINRRIAEWRRGGVKLSFVVARLDNLAALDAQGIRGRDRAMLHAGEYLKQALREMDQIALVAGEIFGMLLPTAALADAARIAERMRVGVQDGALEEQLGAAVTISCGVAEVMPDDGGDGLILRARRAMETARRRGGNAVFVNDGEVSKPVSELAELGLVKCTP